MPDPSSGSKRCVIIGLISLLLLVAITIPLVYVVIRFASPLTNSSPRQYLNDSTATATFVTPPGPHLRLPVAVKPYHYALYLKTYLPFDSQRDLVIPKAKEFTIDGSVKISARCMQPTNSIWLHAVDLELDPARISVYGMLKDQASRHLPLKSGDELQYLNTTEMVIIQLQDTLKAGENIVITINYTAPIGNELKGAYRSSYETEEGKKGWMMATQFQLPDARRALPCFDEPAYKAEFDVTIEHPMGMSALSNGELDGLKHNLGDGWAVSKFKTSPKMSTYLLAFAVHDFGYRSAATRDNKIVRIWAPRTKLNDTVYAAEITPKILDFLSDYFGIPYPMNKVDQIAVPDFKSGAMENWGLITYRTKLLLYNEQHTSINVKRAITETITHELAHQWFGNIVTLKWWDDLWLNEGFATYMEVVGAEEVTDGFFKLRDNFISVTHHAMEADMKATSHPIVVESNDTKVLMQNFDQISYDKGAAIVQMLNATLGDAAFKLGLQVSSLCLVSMLLHYRKLNPLQSYLRQFQYGNADHNDLWNSLRFSVNQTNSVKSWNGEGPLDVKEFMDRWTLQTNYPLIQIELVEEGTNAAWYKLKQQRFLVGEDVKKSKYKDYGYGHKWYVPIWYTSGYDGKLKFEWLKPDDEIVLQVNQKPLIVNPEAIGFYRVNYDDKNWEQLYELLYEDPTRIAVRTRAQLIDDAFNIARAGIPNGYTNALRFARYLSKERNHIVWSTAGRVLYYIYAQLRLTPHYNVINNFLKTIVGPMYSDKDKLNKDDFLESLLYATTFEWACRVEHSDCQADALTAFNSFKASCPADASNCVNRISPIIRGYVYCEAVKYGGEHTFNYFAERFKHVKSDVEKGYIINGLSCAKETWLASKFLNEFILEDKFGARRTQMLDIIKTVSKSPYSRNLAWQFVKDNFDVLFGTFEENVGLLLVTTTEHMNTEAVLKEFDELIGNQTAARTVTISKSIDTARNNLLCNIDWISRHADTVANIARQQNAEPVNV